MANEVEKMFEYPARLQMSMLAPVKAMAEKIPEGDKEVRVVGYVFGEARGVSYRNNPNSTDGAEVCGARGASFRRSVPAAAGSGGGCRGRARLRSDDP